MLSRKNLAVVVLELESLSIALLSVDDNDDAGEQAETGNEEAGFRIELCCCADVVVRRVGFFLLLNVPELPAEHILAPLLDVFRFFDPPPPTAPLCCTGDVLFWDFKFK